MKTKQIDVTSLSEDQLSRLFSDTRAELLMRERQATDKVDMGVEIKGHEAVKRALLVASVSERSVLLVGPEGCGKTMLRKLARDLGTGPTLERWWCPCGGAGHQHRLCTCTGLQRERWESKLLVLAQSFDLCIGVYPVPISTLQNKLHGTSLATLVEQRDLARNSPAVPLVIDRDSELLEKQAVSELGLSTKVVMRARANAADIARLAGETAIKMYHLAESIQYSRLARI